MIESEKERRTFGFNEYVQRMLAPLNVEIINAVGTKFIIF